MSGILHRLARSGEIDWLSYYFAELIARQARLSIDELPCLSAALACEANLRGDVCIELDDFGATPIWQGARLDPAQLDAPTDAEDWRRRLRSCPAIGEPGESAPLTLDGSRLYLNRYWHYEYQVARKILSLLDGAVEQDATAIKQQAGRLFALGDTVDADQMDAIVRAANKSFCVISGGPGTGKTTTVVRILLTLKTLQPDLRIALAAPTGRAAARMLESIRAGIARLEIDPDLAAILPDSAATMHRLLGYTRDHFRYGDEHRLPYDCVVIDEASMVDLELMYRLLRALPDRARLILLGDRDQLASVSAGNVLGDITGHGLELEQATARIADSVVLLRHSYRFDRSGGIGRLAAQVNLGCHEDALALLETGSEEVGWYQPQQEALTMQALDWILDAYQGVFDADDVDAALKAHASIRVLAATNQGELGIDTLNRLISARLLSRNHRPDADRFHGLPIMVLRNQHDLDIFNGDTGILWESDGKLRAWFRGSDNSLHGIALNRLLDYAPAWASTVHKAQGAEFDSVMLVLPAADDSDALSRELVYTAITRARRRFLLHASRAVASAAVDRLSRRHSALAERLGWPPARPPGPA